MKTKPKEEIENINALYEAAFEHYSKDSKAAAEMAGAEGEDTVTLAVWTVIGNMLLNLDETLTKG